MADWQPKQAGPNTHRKMFHWVWQQFKTVGKLLGDEGGTLPPDPPPIPGHQHWHDNLINVLPDQHHPQIHDLDSHSDVTLVGELDGEALMWDATAAEWQNKAPRAESWPTGLVDGGELNIGPGINDIEVIAGTGVIVDSYTTPDAQPADLRVDWTQINEPITAAPAVAGSIVHFTIDSGGLLNQYAIPPSEPVRRDEIYLGLVVHNGDTWGEISSPIVINNAAHTLAEFLKRVAGPTFVIDGGNVTEAALFTLDQDAGTLWEHNRNWHVNKKDPHREPIPLTIGLQWKYVNRDFTDVSALTGTIDPSQYDNAGTVEGVPLPVQTATVQQLYQDPRDNYWILWGQQVFDNATEAAASIAVPTEVPALLQGSVLLGFIVSEQNRTEWDVDQAFLVYPQGGGGVGGGGVPITKYLDLADTPGSFVGDKQKVATVDLGELLLVHDFRSKYITPYVLGATYYPQQWLTDQTYISIANVETTDEAFPQNVGLPSRTYPDPNPFLTAANTSQVRSGHVYTFITPGLVQALWVWVPELTPDVRYSIVSIIDPNGSPIITRTDLGNASLTVDAWTLVTTNSILYAAGSEVLVYLEAQNFGSATQVTGGWVSEGQQNTAAPPAQNWNHNNAQSIVRIDKTDLNTTDRTAELLGIISGSTMLFAETAVPTSSRSYLVLAPPVDLGTYIEYSVSLQSSSGIITDGQNSTLTADVPVSQSTEFGFETDKWLAGEPTWATVESFLQYDGVTQAPGPDTGYGIDIQFQELVQSPDWDLISLGGGGGGGGSGGDVTTFWGGDLAGDISNLNSGNVGVGTTAPADPLHIKASTPSLRFEDSDAVTTDTLGGFISWYDSLAVRAGWVGYGAANGFLEINNQVTGGSVAIRTENAERMRITSAGAVGIGTTNPAGFLHVAGLTTVDGIATQALLDVRRMGGQVLTGADIARIQFKAEDDAGTGRVVGRIRMYAQNDILNTARNSDMVFETASGSGTSERMRITDVGNVGIGTDAPNVLLHVSAAATNRVKIENTAGGQAGLTLLSGANETRLYQNGVNLSFQHLPVGYMNFYTSNVEQMRIDSTGRVQIGTTLSAATVLTLNHPSQAQLSLTEADVIGLRFQTIGGPGYLDTQEDMIFRTLLTAERMRIDSAGNVGIGTAAPTTKLDIVDGSINVQYRVAGTGGVPNTPEEIVSYGIGSNAATLSSIRGFNEFSGNLKTGLAFYTADGTAPVEAMRITSAGKVGIGTTAPNATLEVYGGETQALPGFAVYRIGFAQGIRMWGSASGTFLQCTPTNDKNFFIENHGIGDILIRAKGVDAIVRFMAGGTAERMRISATGNVGIGLTNPGVPLAVQSNSSALALDIRGRTLDEISILRFLNNASSIVQAQIESRPTYLDLRADPAGSYIRFTTLALERMRIDSAGGWFLGTQVIQQPVTTWGQVTAAAGIIGGRDFSVAKGGTGIYILTFTKAATATDAQSCVATVNSIFGLLATAVPTSTTTVQVNTINTSNASADAAFQFQRMCF